MAEVPIQLESLTSQSINSVSSLHTQLITGEQEFAALADQWQKLAALDDQAAIFNDWHWCSLWWHHYKHLGKLYVLLVFNNQQLVGIAPFYHNSSRSLGVFKQHTLRFIGTGGDTAPDDVNMLALPAVRQQVVDVVWDHLESVKFERLLFSDLVIESSFNQTGLKRLRSGRGFTTKPKIYTRRIAQLPADWPSFRQQISRNTHKQIKRRQNRLATAGEVSFDLCQSETEVDDAFDALVRLHNARWQSKGGGGAFTSEAYCGFHRAFMRELHANNQLWLITLKVDKKIIGVEYAFEYKKTLMFFQTGFDPEFEQLSPGHVLMTFAIKRAIETGLRRIDLLKGDYQYKVSYTNAQLQSASWMHYSTAPLSAIAKLRDKIQQRNN